MSIREAVLDVIVDVTAKNVDAFDTVGAGARGLASDLDDASSKADRAAGRFDGLADSADGLDSKAAAATGAMGALSSGFELIGADKAAETLQAAAMATDFLSGAGQALNLVMDLEIAKKVASAAATAAQTTATVAQTAASKAAAVGQWALNAALTANPIGIIIALVVALAVAVVVAYKRSDEFRDKVDAAMSVAKAAFASVSGAISDVVGWLRDKVPPAFSWLQDKAASVIKTAFAPVDLARSAIEGLRDFFRDKVSPAVDAMKAAVTPALEALATPITAAKSAVEDLIAWIAKIDFPSPPKWVTDLGGKLGLKMSAGSVPLIPGATSAPTTDPNVVLLLTAIRDLLATAVGTPATSAGVVDSSTLARLIGELLRREGIIKGYAA